MEPSIAAAKAGVTTGEWGQVLREVFGEYRAPTGIGAKRQPDAARLEEVRHLVDELSGKLGRRLTFVVGKPGLDGHSNGAEQIAVRATDVGMEVVYDGIRLTPAQIVEQAREARAHVLGLSILSGSHVALVRDVAQRMREAGLGEVPIVVGGIIPADDVNVLKQCGAVGRLHAEGLPAQRHHDRHREAGRRQGGRARRSSHPRAAAAGPRARAAREARCAIGLARRRGPGASRRLPPRPKTAPIPAPRPSPPAAATSWSRATRRRAPATRPAAPAPSWKARPMCSSTASPPRFRATRPAAAARSPPAPQGVFINGKPMARVGDAAGCAGK